MVKRPSPTKIEPDKQRRCLKCREWFDSTGPGNRICRKCNYQNSQIVDRSETQSTPSRAVRLGSQ